MISTSTHARTVALAAALMVLALLTVACGEEISGADLYASECSRCHDSDRSGFEGAGPDLSLSSFALEETDEWLTDRIAMGYREMPRFGSVLTGEHVAVLVAFLRDLKTDDRLHSEPPAERPSDVDATLKLGRRLFERESPKYGCGNCHGSDAAGTEDGPSIVGASKSGIFDAIDGVSDMSDIELDAEELEAVYRYLRSLSMGG